MEGIIETCLVVRKVGCWGKSALLSEVVPVKCCTQKLGFVVAMHLCGVWMWVRNDTSGSAKRNCDYLGKVPKERYGYLR